MNPLLIPLYYAPITTYHINSCKKISVTGLIDIRILYEPAALIFSNSLHITFTFKVLAGHSYVTMLNKVDDNALYFQVILKKRQ